MNVAVYQSMQLNKYEVQSDAIDEAEADSKLVNQNSLVLRSHSILTPFLEGSVKLTCM